MHHRRAASCTAVTVPYPLSAGRNPRSYSSPSWMGWRPRGSFEADVTNRIPCRVGRVTPPWCTGVMAWARWPRGAPRSCRQGQGPSNRALLARRPSSTGGQATGIIDRLLASSSELRSLFCERGRAVGERSRGDIPCDCRARSGSGEPAWLHLASLPVERLALGEGRAEAVTFECRGGGGGVSALCV